MAKKKLVTVAKGVKVKKSVEDKMRSKKGSSNTGKYKSVAPKEFAGASGGASKFSYPINTRKRAKAALSYAHYAPNPSGIRAAVKKKYPNLGKSKKVNNEKKKDQKEKA
jgi:hypothetical protein